MTASSGVAPLAGVVIPAHNEENVIRRLLDSLLDGPSPLEIVVVCNGCSDRTAEVARTYADRLTVLETPIASKIRALRLGDEVATTYPRMFIDADVVIDNASVTELVRTLAGGTVLAAGPVRTIPLDGVSRLVRIYYAVWEQLPAVRDGLWGRGVIAVSREGHARLGDVAEATSDDLAMGVAFGPHERTIVTSATSVIRPPRSLADLLRRRRRSVSGDAELEGSGTDLGGSRTRTRDLVTLVRASPANVPGVAMLLVIAVAARVEARWARARGATGWARDLSSRESA